MVNEVEIDGVDYSRQSDLDHTMNLLDYRVLEKTYIIVGCGGIGFWAGIILAMYGMKNFVLIDGDKIENSNLNRLPVPPNWVGHNKAIALRRVIRQMRPCTTINCIIKKIDDDNISLLKSIMESNRAHYGTNLIDTTDNAVIQKKLYTLCDDENVKYVKIGYEGLDVGWYPTYDVWIPENYTPGYRTTQSNVISSTVSAGLGVLSMLLRNTNDVTTNLRDIVNGVDRTPPKPVVRPPIATGRTCNNCAWADTVDGECSCEEECTDYSQWEAR